MPRHLTRAQLICAAIIAIMALLVPVLAHGRGVRLDMASYSGAASAAVLMLCVAALLAREGKGIRVVHTLICLAIFALFTNAGATLNFLLLRPGAVMLDPLLMRADAALGFDWRTFAQAVSHWGTAAPALGKVYLSTLPQILLVLVFLGLTGRLVELHRLILVGVIGSCVSLAIWTVAPSIGPAPWVPLDPATLHRLVPVVDPAYGRRLLQLMEQPPAVIRQGDLIGLIAFPSMHTVMAGMAVFYARGTRLFVPLALLNLPMMPAILVHGGHHLTDVLGGAVLFAVLAVVAARLVPRSPEEPASLAVRQAHTASGGKLIKIASILPPVFRPNSVPRS